MSLRVRVVALIGTVLLFSMLLGALVAGYQARQALSAELDAGLRGAEQTVGGAFEDLPQSDHQARDLHQLVATFDGDRHVRAALISGDGRTIQASRTQASGTKAPAWFQSLLAAAPTSVALPVPGNVQGYAAIRLTPTPQIDVGDAWREFVGVILVLVGSALIGLVLVYLVIGAAFLPLKLLSAQFARIGAGDYTGQVEATGPAELLSLQRGFNEMAAQLLRTTERNRLLTDQLLTIQDEERADIARDLHDEIGPLLFGVNMDAEMIAKLYETGQAEAAPERVRSIQTAVGQMQRQVRDLLGRLRPTAVTEFGLKTALADLMRFWTARRPDIDFALQGADDEDRLSDAVKEAVYRIVQEAMNNAVRHGDPKSVRIGLEACEPGELVITIFDDGVQGGGERKTGGLGLLGMRERVTALGGSLLFGRNEGAGGWSVVARLPIPAPTRVLAGMEAAP